MVDEELVESVTEAVWGEYGEGFGRRTIGVDIGFSEIVESVLEEVERRSSGRGLDLNIKVSDGDE